MTIKIGVEEYKNLLKAKYKMILLESGGVDNWEWYGESLNPDGYQSYADYCEEIDEENFEE